MCIFLRLNIYFSVDAFLKFILVIKIYAKRNIGSKLVEHLLAVIIHMDLRSMLNSQQRTKKNSDSQAESESRPGLGWHWCLRGSPGGVRGQEWRGAEKKVSPRKCDMLVTWVRLVYFSVKKNILYWETLKTWLHTLCKATDLTHGYLMLIVTLIVFERPVNFELEWLQL